MPAACCDAAAASGAASPSAEPARGRSGICGCVGFPVGVAAAVMVCFGRSCVAHAAHLEALVLAQCHGCLAAAAACRASRVLLLPPSLPLPLLLPAPPQRRAGLTPAAQLGCLQSQVSRARSRDLWRNKRAPHAGFGFSWSINITVACRLPLQQCANPPAGQQHLSRDLKPTMWYNVIWKRTKVD
jgi:hypothetical protein